MCFLLSKGSYLFLMQIQFFLNKAADLIKGRSLCGLQAPACLHDAIPAKPKRDRVVMLYFCEAAAESAPLLFCSSTAGPDHQSLGICAHSPEVLSSPSSLFSCLSDSWLV